MNKTIEQKAKAYDEAIERANDILKGYDPKEGSKATINYIFPGLTESENKRIRKVLIEGFKRYDDEFLFNGCLVKEILSWLEEQKDYIKLPNSAYTSNRDVIEFADEYSHTVWEKLMNKFKENENYNIGCNDVSDIVLNAIINTYNWLEKQGKKEFTFKSIPRLLEMIEPTDKAKSYCQKLIDSLVKEGYTADAKIVEACLKQMNGENVAMAVMDKKPLIIIPKFRVGDEVVTKNEESLTITRIDEEGYWSNDLFICGFDDSDEWELVEQKPYGQRKECLDCQFNYASECKGSCPMKRNEQKPANKKELKKIHVIDEGKAEIDHCFTKMMNGEKVSSTWSEEDENMVRYIGNAITCKESTKYLEEKGIDIIKAHRWLESFKPQPKQEWSEEDKERYISCLQRLGTGNPDQPETINSKWFKEHVTFLPKRKPSDEQMHYLANIKLGNSVVK